MFLKDRLNHGNVAQFYSWQLSSWCLLTFSPEILPLFSTVLKIWHLAKTSTVCCATADTSCVNFFIKDTRTEEQVSQVLLGVSTWLPANNRDITLADAR